MQGHIFTQAEVQAATAPLHEDLLDQHPRYMALAKYTAEAVGRGHQHADVIPALQFALDATLAVLSLPSVKARMPQESLHRSVVAQDAAHSIAEAAIRTNLFQQYYRDSPYLEPLLTAELGLTLRDKKYIVSLTKQPIQDAGIVMGGAAWALRKERPGIAAASAVAQSSGLMRVAGADRIGITALLPALGATPEVRYCRPEHYVIEGEGNDITIDFTSEAHQLISQYSSGGGCPARSMRSHDSVYKTVLQKWWVEVSDVLLPPNVTTYGNRGRARQRPKKRK